MVAETMKKIVKEQTIQWGKLIVSTFAMGVCLSSALKSANHIGFLDGLKRVLEEKQKEDLEREITE